MSLFSKLKQAVNQTEELNNEESIKKYIADTYPDNYVFENGALYNKAIYDRDKNGKQTTIQDYLKCAITTYFMLLNGYSSSPTKNYVKTLKFMANLLLSSFDDCGLNEQMDLATKAQLQQYLNYVKQAETTFEKFSKYENGMFDSSKAALQVFINGQINVVSILAQLFSI